MTWCLCVGVLLCACLGVFCGVRVSVRLGVLGSGCVGVSMVVSVFCGVPRFFGGIKNYC